MYKAGIAGNNAPRAVPMMLDTMAVIDQKDQVVDISFVAQRQSLMVQTVRLTMDIPQLLNTVADVPVAQVQQFVRSCGRQLRSHSCSSVVSLGKVVDIPVMVQMQIPLVWLP